MSLKLNWDRRCVEPFYVGFILLFFLQIFVLFTFQHKSTSTSVAEENTATQSCEVKLQ